MIVVSVFQQERAAMRQNAACRPHYAPDTDDGQRFLVRIHAAFPRRGADAVASRFRDSYSGLFFGTLLT
jgi:hypothetical protein